MFRLIIAGDTVPTDQSRALFESGDIQALFHDVLHEFTKADRVILNLECALTESEGAIRKFGPNLKGPIQMAETLRVAGVTDCALANNHMLDFGVAGMRDTIRALEQAGLGWFGASETDDDLRPLIVDAGGKKIAIIAVNEHEYTYALPDQPGATPFDPFRTLCEVAALKSQYDFVVVLYHGGKEHCEYPSPRLRSACRAMVRLGADLVLCQHSHIIGCREVFEGKHIVYGQGNFHFVKYLDKPSWQTGLMVGLDVGDEFAVQYLPVVAGDEGIALAKGQQAKDVMDGFEERSAALLDGRWLDGWRAFCESVADQYRRSVRDALCDPDKPDATELFSHYLDCEAHTDVYRELFKTRHAAKTDGA